MDERMVFAPLKNKQGGDRKKVFLFILDENKLVRNLREEKLVALQPTWVGTGQINHAFKELILFMLRKTNFSLWHLPATYFFGDPKNFKQANDLFEKNFAEQINGIEKDKIGVNVMPMK